MMSKMVKSCLIKECSKCNGFGGKLEEVLPDGEHVYSSCCVACKAHGQVYKEIVVIDENGCIVDNTDIEDEFYGLREEFVFDPVDLCIPKF